MARPSCCVALIVLLAIAAFAPTAFANEHEVVFAVRRTQLHTRAGEAAPIVGHAEEGDELEVLGDRGRWLRVRSGKQIGWLTRTEVSNTKPAEPHGRRQRSGFSGKPVDDVLKVAIAIDHVSSLDEPRANAHSVVELARGDTVTVVGRNEAGWILVQPESGKLGWIPAAVVGDPLSLTNPREAAPQVAAVAATPTPSAVPTEPPATKPRLTGGLLATAGAQSFKMSDGDATAIATGPLAVLTARGQLPISSAFWIGAVAAAELGSADMTYSNATATSEPMSTRQLAIDGHGELGWGGPSYLALRGGVHYATLKVSSDRSEPMLLGERIGGATVGLGGGLPVYRTLVFSASVDAMPAGAQKLSRMPPGTLYATTVRQLWANSSLSMALPAHLMAAVCYRFSALTAQLTDGAATPKTGSRTDQAHVVTAGIGMSW